MWTNNTYAGEILFILFGYGTFLNFFGTMCESMENLMEEEQ